MFETVCIIIAIMTFVFSDGDGWFISLILLVLSFGSCALSTDEIKFKNTTSNEAREGAEVIKRITQNPPPDKHIRYIGECYRDGEYGRPFIVATDVGNDSYIVFQQDFGKTLIGIRLGNFQYKTDCPQKLQKLYQQMRKL